MIWLVTIPIALVAAYAILNLLIDTGAGTAGKTPYWVLLAASASILYVAWFHPIHITFA